MRFYRCCSSLAMLQRQLYLQTFSSLLLLLLLLLLNERIPSVVQQQHSLLFSSPSLFGGRGGGGGVVVVSASAWLGQNINHARTFQTIRTRATTTTTKLHFMDWRQQQPQRQKSITTTTTPSVLREQQTTSTTGQQQSPPSNVKILILPGFGNDSNDYYLPEQPMGSLVTSLMKRGWIYHHDDDTNNNNMNQMQQNQIYVVPIQRTDWLQVFIKGIFDIEFWKGCAPPTRPAFKWYLDKVITCIEDMITIQQQEETETDDDTSATRTTNFSNQTKIIIIGHSAGGWLGRAAIGYYYDQQQQQTTTAETDNDNKNKNHKSKWNILQSIAGFVTLGSPNLPPPPFVMDMTRGALLATSRDFPGAYYNNNHHHNDQQEQDEDTTTPTLSSTNNDPNHSVFYMTVIGNAVQGVKKEEKQSSSSTTSVDERTTITTNSSSSSIQNFAYNSYYACCGNGTTFGDGVVPIEVAHLQGAIQMNLTNVYHSINVPEQWYGSHTILDLWHTPMLQQME